MPAPSPPREHAPRVEVEFSGGTLIVRAHGDPPSDQGWAAWLPESFVLDPRVDGFRGPGLAYRELMLALVRDEVSFDDGARDYDRIDLRHQARFPPRAYQQEALDAWESAGRLGVVVLPTGAGKSFLAEMAMREAGRPTLVVTPTIDLMNQWYDGLEAAFGREIGLLGGGYHEVRELTVTTYDSAYLHMERLGNRFGMVVFDEVHHLPGESYSFAAECCLAPFRLGLTATPERADGLEVRLDDLVGPLVYRKRIRDLAGVHLADYETVRVDVDLDEHERERYQQCRQVYLNFRHAKGINMRRPDGWKQFIKVASRSKAGRKAWKAYREQRRIALSCRAKLDYLEKLLRKHARDRIIIFTNDNDTVYEISRQFLLPAITYQTLTRERKEILKRFNAGEYHAVVTSHVLNEGVNVPEANVAIVLSGTGSVRAHVQRLGRILRKQEGKHAVLYEMIAAETGERYTSERRREHEAYR